MATKKEEKKAEGPPEETVSTSQAVAAPRNMSVAPELEDLFSQDEGAGLENVMKDVTIPFIGILQALSPQINRRKEQYITGAESGMFFNNVTNELWDGDEGVEVIPCFYEKVVNEWIPRDDGGGFVASHANMEDAKANSQPGHDLVDTTNYYVLVKSSSGAYEPAVISMKSTQLKASRRWNSLMSMLKVMIRGERKTPPMQGTRWLLTTTEQTNDKGTFFNYKIEFADVVRDKSLYERAKEFGQMAEKGLRRPNFNADQTVVDEEDDGNPAM
jgi:hypothetical protein